MQTSKFAVFRTVCEIYLTNSSEPYIKLKPCLLSILYVLNYFKYSRTFHITLGPILLTFFLTCVTSEMHFAKLTIIISSEMGSAFSHNDTMMSSTFLHPNICSIILLCSNFGNNFSILHNLMIKLSSI